MASPNHLHFDNTLGVILVGTIISSMLYGITNVQTFIYFQRSSKDPKYMRGLVAFLWILDSLHMAFIGHTVYYYMVDNFLNPFSLISPTWSFKSNIILTHISDAFIRSIFAWRIWILSGGNWKLLSSVITLAMIDLVGGLGFGIKTYFYTTFADFHRLAWVIYATLGINGLADLWTAASLCYCLNKSRSGIKRTDSMISTLMLYCINTGLLTSVFSIGCLVSYATMPTNFVFIAFYAQLPKLYLNALLATLNARDAMRERINHTQAIVSQSQPMFAMYDIRSSPASSQNEKADSALRHHLSVNIESVTDSELSSQLRDFQSSVHKPDNYKESFV
ncbi:hypothetical protein BD410DRAFT_377452 [Rickenella mellea]|uniref:DUF6534 domain-containing protein n=1 Tax=Rickenella mellea TaxID=50990 RepID=A0A4Y7PY39_9AGAM|nr:hypothetical protein BD410DRAFT_377452 [Rickenella mellea]